jgi:hypothetical protein
VTEHCDDDGVTTPVLGCLSSQPPSEPSTPASVTLTGFVTVLSSGGNSNNIIVRVFDAGAVTNPGDLYTVAPFGSFVTSLPASGTPADADVRACPTEQVNQSMHIGCVPPANSACSPACQDTVTGAEFCYVPPGGSVGTCVDRSRYEPRYAIPNIPTRTPLLIVTTGPNGKDDATWRMVAAQNQYVSTNAPECTSDRVTDCFHDKAGASPSYELNANALSRPDHSIILVVAGIASGTTPGRGDILGEVRDCTDTRLHFAQVGVHPPEGKLTYFNGNQWNTLPLVTALQGTCRLGLFANLDRAPGDVQIEAYGLVGGSVGSLGWYSGLVFADATTFIPINAGRPLQLAP